VALLFTLSVLVHRPAWRWAVRCFVACGIACVYLGQQRSVWIALMVGMLVLLVLHPDWRRRLPPIALAALPVLGLLVVALLQLSQVPGRPLPTGVDRFAAGLLTPRADPTAAWRLAAWSEALDRVRADPLTGGGLGAPFGWDYAGTQVENRPHNTFLTVVVKSGVPGLLLLLLPLLWLYATCVRRSLEPTLPPGARRPLVGLLAAHVAVTVYGGFNLLLESPYVAWPYWALAGAIVASLPTANAAPAGGAEC
jgi:O-antigen ligase